MLVAVSVGGEELKWNQLAYHQLMSQPRTSYSPHSTAKTNDKSTFLRKRMVSSVISDVRFRTLRDNSSEEVDFMIIIFIIVTRKPFTSK